MKPVLAVLALLFVVPALVVAGPVLPDYQKDGVKLLGSACDAGNTIVTNWYGKTSDWELVVVTTKSGDIFYNLVNTDGENFFGMKPKGSNETQWRDKNEVETELQKTAPNFYNALNDKENDCEPS